MSGGGELNRLAAACISTTRSFSAVGTLVGGGGFEPPPVAARVGLFRVQTCAARTHAHKQEPAGVACTGGLYVQGRIINASFTRMPFRRRERCTIKSA